MGKRLIQQARGKGGPTYRAPSFRYLGEAKYVSLENQTLNGKIIDIVKCQGHSSPLAYVEYENGRSCYLIAPENIRLGDEIQIGSEAQINPGNVLPLENIPEGTFVFNIEQVPGDGGKFVRSTGTFAKVIGQVKDGIVVQLPSKKKKTFNPKSRASIGIVSAGARKEKPFLKAGNKYHAMRARNKLYPKISGAAQNAVDHPFGNSRTSRKSKARPAPKNAPPGRKVGMLRPKHTGRNK